MMKNKGFTLAIVATLAILILSGSAYIISERQRAVVLRFGELIEPNVPPGLHFKLPLVDKVKSFDGRLQSLEVPQARFMTQEKKALIVDAFVKWRISDVKTFYRITSGDKRRANDLLSRRAESALRNKFGSMTLHEVVSSQRDELMTTITNSLNKSSAKLGMEIVDVRVKKIDLPPQVSDSVFQRMSSEREKEAQEYRSRGKQVAEKTKALADREYVIILADAYKEAEKLKGQGDAKASQIYAATFGKNPDFYGFYRRLQAYKETFDDKSDIMIVEPNTDFFKYINSLDKKK